MANKSNKQEREWKEMLSVFSDPRTLRTAWRAVGSAILRNPASKPVIRYNKEGDETYDSMVEGYTYQRLRQDILAITGGQDREPTELEMILACQAVKARTDTSAATFVRDTLGAKPVDESKVDQTVNAFESLSDEELELLARHRAQQNSCASDDSGTLAPDSSATTIVRGGTDGNS